ncbi:hypothetical protein, partial [Escherichia coli]|uniref:hypothetical protein n=1 Tax=Escherichia coli TaxID=562 RepID=UPI001C52D354
MPSEYDEQRGSTDTQLPGEYDLFDLMAKVTEEILHAPVEFVLVVVTLVTAFYARYYGARWRDIVNIFMSNIKEA